MYNFYDDLYNFFIQLYNFFIIINLSFLYNYFNKSNITYYFRLTINSNFEILLISYHYSHTNFIFVCGILYIL